MIVVNVGTLCVVVVVVVTEISGNRSSGFCTHVSKWVMVVLDVKVDVAALIILILVIVLVVAVKWLLQ